MVHEMRTVITVDDYDAAVAFYRDRLGLEVADEFDQGGRGIILEAGRATLEIFDRAQRAWVDELEAGRLTEGDVRIAFRIDDVDTTFHELVVAGSPLMSHPVDAPWGDRIARLQTPHGMQMTLFAGGDEDA